MHRWPSSFSPSVSFQLNQRGKLPLELTQLTSQLIAHRITSGWECFMKMKQVRLEVSETSSFNCTGRLFHGRMNVLCGPLSGLSNKRTELFIARYENICGAGRCPCNWLVCKKCWMKRLNTSPDVKEQNTHWHRWMPSEKCDLKKGSFCRVEMKHKLCRKKLLVFT